MKRALAILAGLLLAALGTFVAVSPAYAAQWDCPVGTMCTWNDYTGQGSIRWVFSFSGSGGSGHCNTLTSSTGDNNWSSLRNDFGSGTANRYEVILFSDSFCNENDNLGDVYHGDYSFNYYPQFNKVVSSYKLYGPCHC